MNNNSQWNRLQQFSAFQTIIAFLLPSVFAFTGFRVVLPSLVSNGYPKVLMWGIVATAMLLIFVFIGFFLIRKDAKKAGISIADRLLLKKIGLKQWLICVGILVAGLVLSVGATPLVALFEKLPFLSIPHYMPFWLNPSIDPMNTSPDVLSPGYALKGNALVLVIMSVCLLLNILAEEIYFRAWLLPKMQRFGKWSWVLNGLLFALYHTFQLWLFPIIFVLSLATAVTVHISKSILPAFAVHFIANFIMGVLGILFLVIG